MSFDYTTHVVYGFTLPVTEEVVSKLEEHFELPTDSDLDLYERLREFPYMKELDVSLYETEGAALYEDVEEIIVSIPEISSHISRVSWVEVTPTILKDHAPTDAIRKVQELFGVPKLNWLIYTTVT